MSQQTPPNPEKPSTLPPAQPQQTIVEEIIYEDVQGGQAGCRGCIYAVVGAGGCFAILVVLLIGAIAVARPAVEDAFSGLLNVFSGERVTRNITVPVVERIQNLQELKTIRYNFSNIVESAVEMPPLLASLYGENVILVAVGHIEAGIDLDLLSQEDVIFEDGTMTITLPVPQILSCFLDEGLTRVVERNRGLFAPTNVELDNSVRRFALEQFLTLAIEDGILLDAANQGESTIRQLVTLGLDDEAELDLNIIFADPDPSASLPDTCPG